MATKSQRAKRRNARLRIQAASATSEPLRIQGEGSVEFVAAKGEGDEKKLPTFKMTAYTGGKMRPRGFSIPVVMDLATTTVAAGSRPIFLGHDAGRIVGHGDITVEAKAIRVEGVMSGHGAAADEVRISAGNGFPWKSSIGAEPGRMDFVEAGRQIEVNGQKFNGPLYVARNSVIYETSFVPLAGDNRSSATVAAGLNQGDSAMGFEAWLKAKGFDLAALSDEQKATLKAAYDLEQKKPDEKPADKKKVEAAQDDEDEVDAIQQLRAEEAQEVARIKAVRKICAKHADLKVKTDAGELDLEAHAIEAGWTADATELYALRASRPAPAIHSRGHETDATLQALQGGLMLRAGIALDAKHWETPAAMMIGLPQWLRANINAEARQRSMEAAHRFYSMSMFDLCVEACRLDGKDVGRDRTAVIQAAFSGSALTQIFTTSVNARLLATYMESPDSTRGWTSETDVPDFKTNDRMQLAKGGALDKLPRGKTASHYNRSDRAESYRIARYAKQFVVDEQDIRDDSMNAIQEMPREMGLAAARLRPDLVYAILFANAALGADSVALFHSTHSNTDTSAALAADKLKTGITKVGLQTDNGVNLSLSPTHLIVPKTLEFTAKELMNSSLIVVTGSTDSVRGNANVLQSALQVVSDSRLDNGVTDPSSGTAYSGDTNDWFLADSKANTIEVGYLAGTGRVPQSRSFVLDRGQWGIGWDIKMDIGAKALDYRGLYRGVG